MNADTALCYVTDAGYLAPSLTSAASFRRWVTPTQAHIYLLAIGCGDIARTLLERSPIEGLSVVDMQEDLDELFPEMNEQIKSARNGLGSHLSLGTLGRLLIQKYIPSTCTKIIYMDGDTFCWDDPSELFAFSPPPGKIAGALCHNTFLRHELTKRGRKTRFYLRGLEVEQDKLYYNAGVLMAAPETWADIGPKALKFVQENPKLCTFHDQSGLNRVASDRYCLMDSRWNFHSIFHNYGFDSTIRPVILHFTGRFKIWHGKAGPWADYYDKYMELFAHYNRPPVEIPQASAAEIERQKLQEMSKGWWPKKMRERLRWRAHRRRYFRITSRAII